MTPQLFQNRPYQDEALDAAWTSFHDRQLYRQIIVLPTGTGKTVVFAGLRRRFDDWFCQFPESHRKVLVLAHREELLDQAADKFAHVNPDLYVDIEQAGRSASPMSDVVIASVPTLAARSGKRMGKFDPEQFRIVVQDEAHHAIAPSFRRVYEYFGFLPPADWRVPPKAPNADVALQYQRQRLAHWDAQHPRRNLLIGVTATVQRGDKIGLEAIFQDIVYHKNIREMVEDGYLCRLRGYRVNSTTSLDMVHIRAGDFSQDELAEAVDTYERNILAVKAYQEYAPGRKAIVFTVNVQHAVDMAQVFREAGVSAAAIHGGMAHDERKQILRDFHDNTLRVVTNCAILTEGFDEPSVDCIIHARPTQSALLYTQMSGRGTRLSPDKRDCLIIDITDVTRKHSLISAPELFGLPADFDLEGGDAIDACYQIEELKKQHKSLNANTAKSLKELQTQAEEIDLLEAAQQRINQTAQLTWVRGNEQVYYLAFANVQNGKHEWLELRRTPSNKWMPVRTDMQRPPVPVGSAYDTIEEGLAAAEAWLKAHNPESYRVKSISSSWRNEPATQNQRNMLSHLGFGDTFDDLTKGKASIMIDVLMRQHRRNVLQNKGLLHAAA